MMVTAAAATPWRCFHSLTPSLKGAEKSRSRLTAASGEKTSRQEPDNDSSPPASEESRLKAGHGPFQRQLPEKEVRFADIQPVVVQLQGQAALADALFVLGGKSQAVAR